MLGQKTALSGALMVVARLISRVIDLVTMLILARMLTPRDFGLVAIAMTMVLILEAALELPLSQALVRLEKIEDSYYDTAFTLALVRGLLICVAVCALAVPFADFYQHPALVPVIMLLGLAPAARGLLNPRMAAFAKNLNFKYEFMFELISKVSAFPIAIGIAWATHSYWSIAIGTVIPPVIMAVLSYAIFPFRPRITLGDWRVFSDFLGWISLSQILLALNFQSEQLLLGKLVPPRLLGMFTISNNLTNIPITALFSPLLRPLLSAFTVLRDDKERLGASYLNASVACVSIGLPLLVGQSIVADPMVRLLLGAKWIGAIFMVKWLALSLIPFLFGMLLTPLSMALGETRQMMWRNLFQMLVKLPLLVIGALKYGFAGVIGARLISETITAVYCMVIIERLCGLTVARQLLGCARCAISAALMAVVVLVINPFVEWGIQPWHVAAQLAVLVTAGVATYIGSMLALWHLAGRPPGIEAIALRIVTGFAKRFRPPERQAVAR